MASLDDQLNKLKYQLAKEKESREAAEARAEAKAEARADEQRKQHEALLKILSQLQSPSGHKEAKNQDTPVQEAPVAGDDGKMSPSNDGESVVPAEAETEWDQLGGRGQAREFAPIVELSSHTHSCRGVNMKMTPPVLKDRKGYPAFREQVKFYAKKCAYDGITCVGSEERDVLLRRGASSVTYDGHLRAWSFFTMAFELPTDIGRFRRSTSPRQFWENTFKWYIPQRAGQQVTLRQQLTNSQVPKTSDPAQKLLKIEDHAELMRDACVKVDDQAVYGAYVAALPSPEYQPEIRELKREQVFDREHMIRLVRAAHELLKDNKKKSPSALAFISDGRNEGGGRGHPGAKRGGRGGGRGRSNSGNGKAKSGDDDGKDAAEDGKKPAKGPMCYNCHVRSHFAADCKTKVCKKCGGRGHDESKCPSPADIETALAVELPGSDEESTTSSVGAAGFMAEEVDAVCGHPQAHVASGKCDGSVPTCGVEGLAMQVEEAMEGWYFDTGASGHMSPSSEGMTNFQPCNKSLRVANGVTLPTEGKGNLVAEFQSGLESVRLQLHEVDYVPKLSYHLLSLSKAVEQGHKYIGDKNGLTMMLKSGKKLLAPNVRNMYLTYGYRPESDVEQACAVIPSGLLPTTGVDINHYHRTTAHTHPRLLRATARSEDQATPMRWMFSGKGT